MGKKGKNQNKLKEEIYYKKGNNGAVNVQSTIPAPAITMTSDASYNNKDGQDDPINFGKPCKYLTAALMKFNGAAPSAEPSFLQDEMSARVRSTVKKRRILNIFTILKFNNKK